MIHTDIHTMTLSGGASCLDLVNTGLETDGIPVERLHDFKDILTLTERLGLLQPAQLQHLRTEAEKNPQAAERCLKQGRKLRGNLTRIFKAVAAKDFTKINKRDLTQINSWRAKALAGQGFRIQPEGLSLGWADPGNALMQPLWVLILSADQLLQNPELKYVKQCAGCDWLFFDKSKSHRRKWCDMQTCGSSAKARRYYQKKKAEG